MLEAVLDLLLPPKPTNVGMRRRAGGRVGWGVMQRRVHPEGAFTYIASGDARV